MADIFIETKLTILKVKRESLENELKVVDAKISQLEEEKAELEYAELEKSLNEHIYSLEEIKSMSAKDFLKNQVAILNQFVARQIH